MSQAARSWLVRLVLFVGLGLPVFLCFNFIYRFAVDVPYWDQWELVPMLDKWSTSSLSFADLFSQHNEHRIFFPRVVMLCLAALTDWDTRYEMWLNFVLVGAVSAVLFKEHRRVFGDGAVSLATFIPCMWLIFSLRQIENLLWGWQLQITMCSLALCGAIALLGQVDKRPRALAGALACAVVCSFSFASGLAVWPAGFIGLLFRAWSQPEDALRQARWRGLAVWCIAGGITVGAYLFHYVKPPDHPGLGYLFQHPGAALHFFAMQLGGSLTTEVDPTVAAAFGAVLIAAGAFVPIAARRGLLDVDRAWLGLPLVAFAWCTAAMVTVGRAGFLGQYPNMGPPSRYTTLTLLGVIGVYRCCLALRPVAIRGAGTGIAALLVFVGTFTTLDTVYPMGTQAWRERSQARATLADWRARPDPEFLWLYLTAKDVRERAVVLERCHTSIFRDPPP